MDSCSAGGLRGCRGGGVSEQRYGQTQGIPVTSKEGCGIFDVGITQKDVECLLNAQVLVWNPLCGLGTQQCAQFASSLTQNDCTADFWGRFQSGPVGIPISLEQILN